MAVEVWDSHNKIADYAWPNLPDAGDILEIDVNGKVQPYEVVKVINYYAIGQAPDVRIITKYIGGWAGIL